MRRRCKQVIRKFINVLFFISLSYPVMSEEAPNNCTKVGEYECCQATSDKSPFFISDEYLQGDKQYENFREVEDDRISKRYIPRGTIIYTPPELYNLESSRDYRLPFKVLSVPNEKLEKTAKSTSRQFFKQMFWGKKNKKRVKAGDIGFMDKRSIRKINDYSFFVNDDAPAYKSPKGNLLNGMKIKPATLGDKFLVSKCCKAESSLESQCQEFHYFQVFNKEDELVENISLYDLGCRFFTNLTAIPNADIDQISGITELLAESKKTSEVFSEAGADSLELIYENNQWKGSRLKTKPKIKLVKLPINQLTGYGPFNTRHYTPDDRGNSDAFVTPDAGCSFLQLAKKFGEECQGPGCQVQFGNAYHKSSWGPHDSHGGGECIDIRPFRKEDDDINAGLTWGTKSRYDRDKTKKFLELAIQAGATNIWFNDQVLNGEFDEEKKKKRNSTLLNGSPLSPFYDDWWEIGVREQPRHNDHIHLCFKSENPRVKKSCREGL